MVTAEEVVDMIASEGGMLETWTTDVRLTLGLSVKDQIMIMVKGLQKYYAKTKTMANREFTAAARAGVDGCDSAGNLGAALNSRPTKGLIESELVKLQVEQGCFLIHGQILFLLSLKAKLISRAVEKTEDIEDWVWNLAADIAIRPVSLPSKLARPGLTPRSTNFSPSHTSTSPQLITLGKAHHLPKRSSLCSRRSKG